MGAFLISPHILAQLAAQETMRRGRVRSRQKCRICGRVGEYDLVGTEDGPRALVCRCGQFVSDRPEIRLRFQKRQYTITHNLKGQRFQTYEDARRALGTIVDQIRSGTFEPMLWASAEENDLLWENYLRAYLARESDRVQAGLISRATFNRKRSLARYLGDLAGTNIRDLKAGQIMDFAAKDHGLSPKTKADLLAELAHILKEAEIRADIERAPHVPRVGVPRHAPRWMSQEQQAAVLEKIDRVHRPVYFFLMQYGCRVSEACALCWDMVDLDLGMFTLSRTLSRRRLSDNTKQRRDNPLPIVGWFAEYLSEIPRGIHDTPVFKNPEAHPTKNKAGFYLPDFLNDRWTEALQAAGVEPIMLKNATRHSAGNQRRREGWDEGLIARLLGHASTAHTRKYYVETDAEMLRNKMGKGKGGKGGQKESGQ